MSKVVIVIPQIRMIGESPNLSGEAWFDLVEVKKTSTTPLEKE